MANTDPRNVAFQIDLYWAANGGGMDNPLDVIERYGHRIQLFHVKDMAAGPFEHDPRFGDPTFDPFEAAETGFNYLDCVTF